VIESVVPHIVDMLKDSDSWVRHSAVSALGEISKQRK
jgi:HEAT repeat protein